MTKRCRLSVEMLIDPRVSVLVAQVQRAMASHRMDTEHGLLRGEHFQGPSKVVYLGDVATCLLASLSNAETPTFVEAPGFNEQRWTITTRSLDLTVTVQSCPYHGWGLFTSGYLNVITLEGPVELRCRLVLDLLSASGHHPWEFKHQRKAQTWLNRHRLGATLKENESHWRELHAQGRDNLAAQIDILKQRGVDHAKRFPRTESNGPWWDLYEEDEHMAWQAHNEDNAPGVERATARMEASLIEIAACERKDEEVKGRQPQTTNGLAGPSLRRSLEVEEDIPFVDLTSGSVEEE